MGVPTAAAVLARVSDVATGSGAEEESAMFWAGEIVELEDIEKETTEEEKYTRPVRWLIERNRTEQRPRI